MSKNDEKENSLVLVDMAELGKGLEAAFRGVSMVFGSLGKTDAEIPAALSGLAMPAVIGKAAEASDDKAAEKPPADKAASAPDDKTPEQPAAQYPKQESKPKPPSGTPTSVTLDDITKVIVAKIKQKRGNNAKIGSLLKTYGADKVSSLPEEKYEAFLTDISQL